MFGPLVKTFSSPTTATLFVGGVLSLFASCSPAPAPTPAPPLPAQLEQLESAVQELVREIHGRAAEAPLDGARWARLGMTYEANNLLPDALLCYERALELEPSDKLRYRRALTLATLGRVEEALAEARLITEDEGHTPPHIHWRMGSWELMRGNLDAAEASFTEATRVGRRYPGGFTGLARVHLQRDENDEALAALNKADLLVPLDGYVAQLFGAAYRQAGRLEEPEASLPSSNDLPNWADPWATELSAFRAVTRKMEAKALGKEGQTGASIAVLEELRASGEDELGALSIMAESYFRAGNLDEALAKFQECRSIAPRNVGTYLNIARVQEEMGARSDAVQTLAEAIEIRPDFGQLYDYRGKLLFIDGRYEEAIVALEKALLLDARLLDTRLWIGRSHLALGSLDEARTVFEETSKRTPPPGDAWIGLAELALAEDDLEAARAAIEKAKELGTEDRFWFEMTAKRIDAAQDAQ